MLQLYDNRLHSTLYFSKKYILAERNYAPHDKELLEIFRACQKWSCYLKGHQNTGFTEHKLLVNLQT